MEQEAKIGDTVICIDDRPWGKGKAPDVIFKKEYKVLDIIKCKCGCISYDVGLKKDSSNSNFTKCRCLEYLPGQTIHWAQSTRFARKETQTESKKENMVLLQPKELLKELSLAN